MKIVALILARGGSKGIPKKNIIDINNKPLLAYSIKAATKANISEVWVSTDCKEIEAVAKNYGACVITRPANLSTHGSQSEDALLHFAKDKTFDIMVFIQPTSPLIQSNDINLGLKLLRNKSNNYDSVFSVYKEHWVPRWTAEGTPYMWNVDNRPMRQDVPKMFVENGAFYITYKKTLLKSKLRYSGKIGMVEMPFSRSFQIDTEDDLKLIRKIIK